MAERGFDDEMGARPLGRVIQEKVKKPIAEEILFGALRNGGVVRVRVDQDDAEKLAFEYIPDQNTIPQIENRRDEDGDEGDGSSNIPVLVE